MRASVRSVGAGPFGRLALHELADDRRLAPDGLVEPSVDHDRGPGRDGLGRNREHHALARVAGGGPG
jgi:hypothetical protein